MKPPSHSAALPKPSHAFTLTELLVVIAVLTSLFFLVLPGFQKTRSQGLASRCQTNLRQISAAFFAFVADHNGIVPHSRQELRVDENENVVAGWFPWNTATLQPYVGTPVSLSTRLKDKRAKHSLAGPFWCPAATDIPVTDATTMAHVVRPHRTLYMIDASGGTTLSASKWPLKKGSPPEPKPDETYIDFKRHGGNFANGLFMDGHIEKLTYEQLVGTGTFHLYPRP